MARRSGPWRFTTDAAGESGRCNSPRTQARCWSNRDPAFPQATSRASDREYVRGNPPTVTQEDNVYRGQSRDDRYSQSGERFRGIGDFFHRLGTRVVRHGEHLENFFTGKKGEHANDR